MPTVRSGNLPNALRDYYTVNKNTGGLQIRQDSNMEYDLIGWHAKSNDKNRGELRPIKLIGLDGKPITMYRSGYDDFIGFHATSDRSDPELLRYGQFAFDKENPSHSQIIDVPGVGHIARLEYNPTEEVLRVTFVEKGSICLFFRVPHAVAGTLIHLAQSGATQGTYKKDGQMVPKHVLGIMFWNLVRIRGQQSGARFPWEYEHKGGYKLTGSNKRYKLIVSDANYKAIKTALGNKLKGDLYKGMEFSAILDEDTFEQLQAERDGSGAQGHLYAKKLARTNERGETTEDYYDSNDIGSDLTTQFAGTDEMGMKSTFSKGSSDQFAGVADLYNWEGEILNRLEAAGMQKTEFERYKTLTKRIAEARGKWEEETKPKHDILAKNKERLEKSFDKSIELLRKGQLDGIENVRELANYVERNVLKDYMDGRANDNKWRVKYDRPKGKFDPKSAFGTRQEYDEWKRLDMQFNPINYVGNTMGRTWHKSDLINMLSNVPGAISPEHRDRYKSFIDNNDWEGAFRFLKDKRYQYNSKGDDGAVHMLKNRHYASSQDKLSLED